MWNRPTKKQLEKLPPLYHNADTSSKDIKIHMHFFMGGTDWYVAEWDGEDIFFGFVILNGDTFNAEWGYFSLNELKELNHRGMQVDRDLHWRPFKASQIDRICECRMGVS